LPKKAPGRCRWHVKPEPTRGEALKWLHWNIIMTPSD